MVHGGCAMTKSHGNRVAMAERRPEWCGPGRSVGSQVAGYGVVACLDKSIPYMMPERTRRLSALSFLAPIPLSMARVLADAQIPIHPVAHRQPALGYQSIGVDAWAHHPGTGVEMYWLTLGAWRQFGRPWRSGVYCQLRHSDTSGRDSHISSSLFLSISRPQ